MKKYQIATTFFLLLVSTHLFSIIEYKKGDSLFVWAESGLNIRVEPDSKSQKIRSIPFGGLVIPQSNKWNNTQYTQIILETHLFKATPDFKGFEIKGVWVKVTYKGQGGFIFDGYLSSMKPPLEDENWNMLKYLKRNYIIKDTIEKAPSLESGRDRFIFEGGIYYSKLYNSGGANVKFIFSKISFEEAFLMINYFYPPYPFLTQEDDETLLYLHDLGQLTIKFINNTIIVFGGWWC